MELKKHKVSFLDQARQEYQINDPEESDRELRSQRQKSPFFLVDSHSQKSVSILSKSEGLDESANSEKLPKPQSAQLKKILRPSSASTNNQGSRQEKVVDSKKTVFSILDPQVPLAQKLADYKEQNKLMA